MEDTIVPDLKEFRTLSNQKKVCIPNIPPHYLIVVVQMILRIFSQDDELSRMILIIQRDPVLGKIFIKKENGKFVLDREIILHTIRILQEAYGQEFYSVGEFTKALENPNVCDTSKTFYNDMIVISLLWNFSPIVKKVEKEDGSVEYTIPVISE
jgi:hypothetical protein